MLTKGKAWVVFWALSPFLFPSGSFAEDVFNLDTVVVTGSRWEEPADESVDRITVITREEIDKLPARDAGEILNTMVGVDGGSYGEAFGFTFPTIQGVETRRITVLVNGIPFSGLYGQMAVIGKIPAEQIERIEVTHGPAGSEWGSVIGGVINIILNEPKGRDGGFVKAGGGEYGTAFGAVKREFATDRISVVAGGGVHNSSGEDENKRSYGNQTGTLNIDAKLGEKTSLFIQGHTFQGDVGTGEFRDQLAGLWQVYNYRTNGIGATLSTTLPVGALKITAYHQNQFQQTDDYTIADGLLAGSPISETSVGGSIIWRGSFDSATLTLGADTRNGEIKTPVLPDPDYTINTSGYFATFQYLVGALRLEGGMRNSSEDYFGDFTGFNLGANYKVNKSITARAAYTSGYTIPTLGDRFFAWDGWWVANPDLKVEKTNLFQLGVNARVGPHFLVDVALFRSDITDGIQNVVREDGLSMYDNIATIDRQGYEAEVRYVNGVYSTFANTLSQESRDASTGEILPDNERRSYGLGAAYNDGRLAGQVTAIWRDMNYPESYGGMDKQWFLNATTSWMLPLEGKNNKLRFSLSVFNLTDEKLWYKAAAPINRRRTIEGMVEYLF